MHRAWEYRRIQIDDQQQVIRLAAVMLLCQRCAVQLFRESWAATRKCYSRVRHFGRVFDFPVETGQCVPRAASGTSDEMTDV